jgi:hypothetical protein
MVWTGPKNNKKFFYFFLNFSRHWSRCSILKRRVMSWSSNKID